MFSDHLFKSDMDDPRQRFMHYDGSCAYAQGLSRLSQRTDVRAGLCLTFGLAVAQVGYGHEMPGAQLAMTVAANAAGAVLSVAFNNLAGHVVRRAALFPHFITHEDDKVYDRTGQTRGKNHAIEVYTAGKMLGEQLLTTVMMSSVLAGICALTVQGGPTASAVLGFMNVHYAKMVLSTYRSWQIKNERISRADGIPELPQKQPAAKMAPV